ncbi:MAG TPA: DUF5666 domain-containing protein [Bryobacteraceae bacterium]|nr:DUF5666 domain-containing protein [Bryobacteraceae bacterium]
MHRRFTAGFAFVVLSIIASPIMLQNLVADDDGGDSADFNGIVQSLPPGTVLGDWRIGGTVVHVSSSTEIDQEENSIGVGSCVEVRGTPLADATVNASRISSEEADKCGAVTVPPPAAQANFSGSVQGLPVSGLVGNWLVSGKTVHVSQATQINQQKGPVSVGACVEIEGTINADGSVTASQIMVESASGGCAPPQNENAEAEFSGVVQKLPAGTSLIGDWLISGRTVHVSATTQMETEGAVLIGSCVEVKGMIAADGSVTATNLEVSRESESCQGNGEPPEQPKFLGTIDGLPASGLLGDWSVNHRAIHVSAATEIETDRGAVIVGACVEIEGALQPDNSISASAIHTEDAARCATMAAEQGNFELAGTVDAMPAAGPAGDWKIGGRTVRVTSATALDAEHGPISIGACVEAKGTLQTDGVLLANRIESRSASGVCLSEEGVISAASLAGASVTPGEMVSLFGFNLGPHASAGLEVDADGRVSNRLSNVRVLFDGVAAPLLFVSSRQINAVVPFGVAGKTQTAVQVENNGAWSNTVTLPVAPASPSIFTLTQSGRGQGAVLNFDSARGAYTVNGPSNAARRGASIVIYATGAGQTNPPGEDGRISSSQWLPRPVASVSVTIGGRPAEVQFAGAAPGIVSGALQVNVKVPDNAPVGAAVPVVIQAGGHTSQNGVMIAIRE